MREIWNHPFGHAILKVERAKKHILDIEERLRTSSDRYGASIKIDAKTGEHFLYCSFIDRALSTDLALMIGDTIHNLRSALDIAWGATIGSPAPRAVTTFTKFPIDPKQPRQWLEGVLTAGKKPLNSSIHRFMVDRVKPYQGGDTDLHALHQLDIDDKHRLIIPVLTVLAINGLEVQGEDGVAETIDVTLTSRLPYRRPVAFGATFKNKGKITFQVRFGKGCVLQDLEVIPTLRKHSAKVGFIVRFLQREFLRLHDKKIES